MHRLVWGGWTVYATGDASSAGGEFSVVGVDPDFVGRRSGWSALLLDRGYGLVAWQPAWLLVVPAAAALCRLRVPGAGPLLLPLLAGWATATLAGADHARLLVAGPAARGGAAACSLVAVLVWLSRLGGPRLRVAAAGLTGAGVVTLAALVVDGWQREITWVTNADLVDDPVSAAVQLLLPDYRSGSGPALWVRHGLWLVALAVASVLAWRSAGRERRDAPAVPPAEAATLSR